MTCRISLLSELPPSACDHAVALYWLAFGGKLGRLLGPEDRALRLLNRVVQPDHALVVINDQGEVLGVAGFRSPQGGFVGLESAHMRAVYGVWGAWWRGVAVQWLTNDIDNSRFLIDGLAVAPDWRGRGLGAALIAALGQEAQRRGYRRLRLDVAVENHRARALYERLGFRVFARDGRVLLRPLLGMSASHAMEKPLL